MLKTTQMGQIGIRSVLDTNLSSDFRSALDSQLKEYDRIETEAHNIAGAKGWKVAELDPGIRTMTDMMTRMRLSGRNNQSRIAGMMIQGNSRGIIKVGKNLNHMQSKDPEITALAGKLLKTENENILQMQKYL